MSFGRFDQGDEGEAMSDINMTPLIDVMLVLLVIFIITAPLLNQAVPVDLPKVSATQVEQKPQVVQLALDGNSQVFINGEVVAGEALATRLQGLAGPETELHLRADRGTRYEKVAEVMATAQRVGIAKIAFVTEEPGRP